MAAEAYYAPAAAQNTPLYNSSGRTSGNTLYRSGAKPLSLNQITQGRSTSGYSYSYSASNPYGSYSATSRGGLPSQAEINAFRQRRSQEAQASERAAMASLSQGHGSGQENPLQTPQSVFSNQQTGYGNGTATQQSGQKVRQIYRGRETGVTKPQRVFNSVR